MQVRIVPSHPNNSFPPRSPTLPLTALIKFFIPTYSTISGESPLICFHQSNKPSHLSTTKYLMPPTKMGKAKEVLKTGKINLMEKTKDRQSFQYLWFKELDSLYIIK